MPKHPNRPPKYMKKPDAMKIEAARELGVTYETGIEVNTKLAAQGEPKYSKKTMHKINSVRKEYNCKNKEK